jgi:hypothetical protein
VNFVTLVSKLVVICASRVGSAKTGSERSPKSVARVMSFASIVGRHDSMACRTVSRRSMRQRHESRHAKEASRKVEGVAALRGFRR